MFAGLKGVFRNELSIDLGTANTLIYSKGEGVVLNEPSVVAIALNPISNTYSDIIAIGHEAKAMLGRTPANISAVRPLKDGVIADFNATERMLHYFINKVNKMSFTKPSPRVLICVPCGATQVERRAIRESALGAGAKDVFLIGEPMAAALGAGMPVHQATGCMVIDIGGGTTEIAILSLNGVVYSSSTKIAGNRFEDAIVSYVRRKFGLLIGDSTAERIKHEIGNAYPCAKIAEIIIRGRNLIEGIPCTITLTSKDICEALQEPLIGILEAIRAALESAPPELAADIEKNGIYLTGGGGLLKDLDKLIQNKTGIKVKIADDPLTCVVRGGGQALELVNEYDFEYFIND